MRGSHTRGSHTGASLCVPSLGGERSRCQVRRVVESQSAAGHNPLHSCSHWCRRGSRSGLARPVRSQFLETVLAGTPTPAIRSSLRVLVPYHGPGPVRRGRHVLTWPGLLAVQELSLIHISEPTRLGMISYAVFCLKKKKK